MSEDTWTPERAERARTLEVQAQRIYRATGIKPMLRETEPGSRNYQMVFWEISGDAKKLADWIEARSALCEVPNQLDDMIARLQRLRGTLP